MSKIRLHNEFSKGLLAPINDHPFVVECTVFSLRFADYFNKRVECHCALNTALIPLSEVSLKSLKQHLAHDEF